MPRWHLDDVLAAFERRGWRRVEELPGDDVRISASWVFERGGVPPARIVVDFDGLDGDGHCLPLEESYACSLRGTGTSLYLRSRASNSGPARDRWLREVEGFVLDVEGSLANVRT